MANYNLEQYQKALELQKKYKDPSSIALMPDNERELLNKINSYVTSYAKDYQNRYFSEDYAAKIRMDEVIPEFGGQKNVKLGTLVDSLKAQGMPGTNEEIGKKLLIDMGRMNDPQKQLLTNEKQPDSENIPQQGEQQQVMKSVLPSYYKNVSADITTGLLKKEPVFEIPGIDVAQKMPETSAEEKEFLTWYMDMAKENKLSLDPYDPKHHYKYFEMYQELKNSPEDIQVDDHFLSKFKEPTHPNRFVVEGNHQNYKIIDTINNKEFSSIDKLGEITDEQKQTLGYYMQQKGIKESKFRAGDMEESIEYKKPKDWQKSLLHSVLSKTTKGGYDIANLVMGKGFGGDWDRKNEISSLRIQRKKLKPGSEQHQHVFDRITANTEVLHIKKAMLNGELDWQQGTERLKELGKTTLKDEAKLWENEIEPIINYSISQDADKDVAKWSQIGMSAAQGLAEIVLTGHVLNGLGMMGTATKGFSNGSKLFMAHTAIKEVPAVASGQVSFGDFLVDMAGSYAMGEMLGAVTKGQMDVARNVAQKFSDMKYPVLSENVAGTVAGELTGMVGAGAGAAAIGSAEGVLKGEPTEGKELLSSAGMMALYHLMGAKGRYKALEPVYNKMKIDRYTEGRFTPGEKLTKNITSEGTGDGRSMVIENNTIRDMISGRHKLSSKEQREAFNDLGLTEKVQHGKNKGAHKKELSRLLRGKQDIKIEISKDKLIKVKDKPYWEKLKNIFKINATNIEIKEPGKTKYQIGDFKPKEVKKPKAPELTKELENKLPGRLIKRVEKIVGTIEEGKLDDARVELRKIQDAEGKLQANMTKPEYDVLVGAVLEADRYLNDKLAEQNQEKVLGRLENIDKLVAAGNLEEAGKEIESFEQEKAEIFEQVGSAEDEVKGYFEDVKKALEARKAGDGRPETGERTPEKLDSFLNELEGMLGEEEETGEGRPETGRPETGRRRKGLDPDTPDIAEIRKWLDEEDGESGDHEAKDLEKMQDLIDLYNKGEFEKLSKGILSRAGAEKEYYVIPFEKFTGFPVPYEVSGKDDKKLFAESLKAHKEKNAKNQKEAAELIIKSKVPFKRLLGRGKFEQATTLQVSDWLNGGDKHLAIEEIAEYGDQYTRDSKNPFPGMMYRGAKREEWDEIVKGGKIGSFWHPRITKSFLGKSKVLIVAKDKSGDINSFKDEVDYGVKFNDIREVYAYDEENKVWGRIYDKHADPKFFDNPEVRSEQPEGSNKELKNKVLIPPTESGVVQEINTADQKAVMAELKRLNELQMSKLKELHAGKIKNNEYLDIQRAVEKRKAEISEQYKKSKEEPEVEEKPEKVYSKGSSIKFKLGNEIQEGIVLRKQSTGYMVKWFSTATEQDFTTGKLREIKVEKTGYIRRDKIVEEEAISTNGERSEELADDIRYSSPYDNRKRGYVKVNGEKVERQGPLKHILQGKDTNYEFSSMAEVSPGKMTLIDANDLQPSHLNKVRNPKHFIAEAQPKERIDEASYAAMMQMSENMDPEKISFNTTNVYSGMPTVNSRGEVIQGNNRAEALKKMWNKSQDKKLAAVAFNYKKWLFNNAEKLGMDEEQINNMMEPVLVNMVDVDDKAAVILGQFDASDLESGGNQRIEARKVINKADERFPELIERLMRSDDDSMTLRETLRKNASDVLDWMLKRDLINYSQSVNALKNDSITPDGLNDLEAIVKHQLFSGTRADIDKMFDRIPYRAQNLLVKNTKNIGTVKDDWNILSELQDAFVGYNEYLDSGVKSFDAWKDQPDAFDNGMTPREKYAGLTMFFIDQFSRSNEKGWSKNMDSKLSSFGYKVKGDLESLLPEEPVTKEVALMEIFGTLSEQSGTEEIDGISFKKKDLDGLKGLFGSGASGKAGQNVDEFSKAGFIEEKYEQAKPYLISSFEQALSSGKTAKDLFETLIKTFGEQIKPYLRQFIKEVRSGAITIKENEDVSGSTENLAGNIQDDNSLNNMGEKNVQPGSREEGQNIGGTGSEDAGKRSGEQGSDVLPGSSAAVAGNESDQPIYRPNGEIGVERQPTGSGLSGGSLAPNDPGTPIEPEGTGPAPESITKTLSLEKKIDLQKKLKPTINFNDPDNIRATLPLLLEEQQEDVIKAERRFFEKQGKGILFTNATGTGKTYTGLGSIYRFYHAGKKDILIVVPTQTKINDWIEEGSRFALPLNALRDTTDPGQGINVTTYANFRQNEKLNERSFDLVVFDECHNIQRGQGNYKTAALEKTKKIVNTPSEADRRIEKKYERQVEELKYKHGRDDYTYAKIPEVEALKAKMEQEKLDLFNKTKVMMLSATPFSYHESLDLADGILFQIQEGADSKGFTGYNEPGARESFYVTNFGYRMRYNKLTKPEAGVDVDLMEREFHERMIKEGVISRRKLAIDKDYSREFVLIESHVGSEVDRGMGILMGAEREFKMRHLPGVLRKLKWFNFLARNQLLEGIKARESIDRIKQHLALGRKIVIFHSYNHGLPRHPFDFSDIAYSPLMTPDAKEELAKFESTYPEFRELDLHGLVNARETLMAALGDRAVEFNGTVNKKNRSEALFNFNRPDSGVDVLVVQVEAGREGISLHDKIGDTPRVEMQLGLPYAPVVAVQTEGRIYRYGTKSNAIYEYVIINTSFERYAFGHKINQRVKTVENLAMGNEARDLDTAFREGYQYPTTAAPNLAQGMGGKEADSRMLEISDFERAKTYYYARQKKTSKNKSWEGVDYFATPEPLGLKMVEWGDFRPNDYGLEPSSGHGAIARFFPGNTTNYFVEPSRELSSQLSINASNGIIKEDSFENLHKVNKFHVIVMNPPFGRNAKTALEHLNKAVGHLRNGGRIIALLPNSTAVQKGLEKLLFEEVEQQEIEGNEPKKKNDMYLVGAIELPGVTFKRAGTSVNTKIVILDKQEDPAKAPNPVPMRTIEANDINEFFDKIENMEFPKRVIDPKESEDLELPDGLEMAKFPHTTTGEMVFVVKLTKRLGTWDFSRYTQLATIFNGKYSKYSKDGAIPGFLFDNPEDRLQFAKKISKGRHYASGTGGFKNVDEFAEIPKPKLKGIELPEAVQLIKYFINTSLVVRRMSKKLRGYFQPISEMIALNADLFTEKNINSEQALKTMMHEFGHLLDYLPDRTMKRGNMLGHMLTLRDMNKGILIKQGVDASILKTREQVMAKLRRALDAERAGKRHKYDIEAIRHRLDVLEGKLLLDKVFRTELWNLSTTWRPLSGNSASYMQYRRKATELYADFISALMTDPEWAEKQAPETFKTFFDYMDRKPDFKKAYFDLMDMLNGPSDAILKARNTNLDRMLEKSRELEKAKRDLRKEQKNSTWFKLKTAIYDRDELIKRMERKLGVKNDSDKVTTLLDERTFIDMDVKHRLEGFQAIRDKMGAYEVSEDELDKFLILLRNLTDRKDIANPQGLQLDANDAQLNFLRKEMGDEKYFRLMEVVDDIQDWWFDNVLEPAIDLVGKKFVDDKLERRQLGYVYATYFVQKYFLEHNVSAKVMEQIGTLNDVMSPHMIMLLKGVAIIRATINNNIKLEAERLFFSKSDEIEPAKITRKKDENGDLIMIPPARKTGKEVLYLKRDGKLRAWYVDPYIYDSFQHDNPLVNQLITSTLGKPNKLIKGLYTTFNVGFQVAFNPIRDFDRTHNDISFRGKNISWVKLLQLNIKNLGHARNRALGIQDDLIDEMEEAKMLFFNFSDYLQGLTEKDLDKLNTIERLLYRYDVIKRKKNWGPLKPVVWLLEQIKHFGDIQESLNKISAYEYLKDEVGEGKIFPEKRDLAAFIRNQVGTPPFTKGGKYSPSTNNILLFSNIALQSYGQDWRAFRDPRTKTGWRWKVFRKVFIPTLLTFLFASGIIPKAIRELFGDDTEAEVMAKWLEESYAMIPEYNKTNYNCIPIGRHNGKCVYLRLPMHETTRFLRAVFWKMLNMGKKQDVLKSASEVFDYTMGQLPGLTPVINLPCKWVAFASGDNPEDKFRGQKIIPEDGFTAGGKEKWDPMLMWTLGQLGMRGSYTNNYNMDKFEKIVKFTPAINRLVKISNYGLSEELENNPEVTKVKREEALRRIAKREFVDGFVEQYFIEAGADSKDLDFKIIGTNYQTLIQEMMGDPDYELDAAKAKQMFFTYAQAVVRKQSNPYVNSLMKQQSNQVKQAKLNKIKSLVDDYKYEEILRICAVTKIINEETFKIEMAKIGKN